MREDDAKSIRFRYEQQNFCARANESRQLRPESSLYGGKNNYIKIICIAQQLSCFVMFFVC